MMDEVGEIYHRPLFSVDLQKLVVTSSQNSEKFSVFKPKISGSKKTPKLNCDHDLPIFKCHSRDEKIPWSLQKQCVAFVAFHAEHLDSLEDFPDDVGRSIWMECGSNGKLRPEQKPEIRDAILKIFVEAYPESILPECRISDLNLMNNFENEFNIFFASVRSLDLDGCRLGDDHDVIRLLLKNSPNLEVLILSRNDLSSKGLRNLFSDLSNLRQNMADSTVSNSRLNYIDLSCNVDVTCRGIVRYVGPISSIDKVVVSSSMISSGGGEKSFDQMMSKEAKFRRKTRPDLRSIPVSKGWAVDLIQGWQNFLKVKAEQKSRSTSDKKSSSFYGSKSTKILPIVNRSSTNCFNENKIMFERIEDRNVPSEKRRKTETEIPDDDDFAQLIRLYKKK